MEKPPAAIRHMVAFVAIREYAAASYIYESGKGDAIMSDGDFDELCVWLLDNYGWIKKHDMNDYLDKGTLKAGSGMGIREKICGQTLEYADMKAGRIQQGELGARLKDYHRKDEPIAAAVARKRVADRKNSLLGSRRG